MNFKMTPEPPGNPRRNRPGQGPGIAGSVESAARARAPAPKGKGIVMMVVGLAVLGALIWDFTGGSAARRAVRKTVGDPSQPVAPSDAGDQPDPAVPQPKPPREPPGRFEIEIATAEGARLHVTPAAASGLIASAPEAQRKALRLGALEALVKPAEQPGHVGRRAFEAASRFVKDAGPAGARIVQSLTIRAYKALADDEVAPAAILFLAQLPDRGGSLTVAALDEVILASDRPLLVRLAAARARPGENLKTSLADLLDDPTAHPALIEALRR